jgi:putative endopeptidase
MLRSRILWLLAAGAVIAAPPALAAEGRGVNRGLMDPKVSPCDDFYRYANGAWIDTVQIPPAYTAVGSGREMVDRNQEVLRQVLESAAKNAATEKDPTLKKLGDLYATLMDSARANREGAKPLEPYFKRLDALKTTADLQGEFEQRFARGIQGPFAFGGFSDFKNSKWIIGIIFQGGLGLPERDYYFRADGKSDTLRREYVAHVTRMLVLTGVPEAQARRDADAIMKFETALAESSITRLAMRDPAKLYNKMTVADLQKLAPGMDWIRFFQAVETPVLAKGDAAINVAVPSFVRQVSTQMKEAPIETWRAYLRFHLARTAANWLSQEFVDENFRMQSLLSGTKTLLPRWKRSIDAIDGAMGDALGKAYVQRSFPPASKARMDEMVADLIAAMDDRIQKLTWMSDVTKAQARKKLQSIVPKIGYPKEWRDYTKLVVDTKLSGVENLGNALAFESRRQYDKIEKAIDPNEWQMTAPTVNAYYSPFNNEIVFPAGILQPPQFDPTADDAFNYGGIGMVIGHEITHGFDDQGRKFDAAGNMQEWWTADDDAKFKARAQKVVEQYSAYVAVDTLRLNGQLTLGENIADLGGATLAYYAYQRYLDRHGRRDIDGFTPEQRFFLGYAQAWRRKVRPETERLRALTDTHSSAEWRVNGPIRNMKEFRAAFGCKEGDKAVHSAAQETEIW